MDAQRLFPGPLSAVYETARHLVLALGDDVIEEFAKSQVSFGSARKFVWLTPLTKTKALLLVDLWEERTGPQLRSVIRYRDDKFTHQIVVRTVEDNEAVSALGWFEEAVSWGAQAASLTSRTGSPARIPAGNCQITFSLDGPPQTDRATRIGSGADPVWCADGCRSWIITTGLCHVPCHQRQRTGNNDASRLRGRGLCSAAR